MKILTLQLENFQGIKSASFDFDGQSASLYGDNATGKTTVFNAITWILFDRPSTGAKNYTPKTKGPDGDLHFLEHAATARFSMEDGRIVTLRKVYHENYKKKRGSATEEFDGHSIDFYIDGVPVKEKEYSATLMAFCGGAEKMKMLTMPNYFAEDMAWDARRKILLDICGDVSDQEVIIRNAELKELPTYLLMPGTTNQHYTVEEYKKIAGAQKTDINKRLQDIPGRIDEAQRAMPDTAGIDTAAIDAQLRDLQKQRDALTEKKATTLAGDAATTEAKKATAEAVARMAEARAAYMTKAAAANEGTQAAIGDIQRQINTARSKADEAQAEAARIKRNIERMTSRRSELLSDYSAIQKETWDESQAVCPTCHRELPEEKVEEMRSAFNLHKSSRLQKINEQGQKEASKEKIDAEQKAHAEQKAEAEAAVREKEDLEQQLAALQAKLKQPEPFEDTQEYADLAAQVAACREKETNAGKCTDEAIQAINGQMDAIQEQARQLQQQKSQAAQAEAQRKRIDELKAQEKQLSAQYEELEKGIYLCDVFTTKKVGMLTERINSKFKNVRFRLFVEQQNGGIKDDCEVMIPTGAGRMVPYTFANNAARINAGLEIIEALSRHWGLTMPVFIDNAESVTHLADLDTQIIRLVVSEADKALRLETEAQRKEGAA